MTAIHVEDIYDPGRVLAVVVDAREPLADVLCRFAEEVSLKGVFVTGGDGQFAGVITHTDVLEWTRLRLGTALANASLTTERILRLGQLARAATAGDAVRPGSARSIVHLDDPVDRALQLMLELDLVAIPVVDASGRILGGLALSQVLGFVCSVRR